MSNSLELNQTRPFVHPDLGPNCLHLHGISAVKRGINENCLHLHEISARNTRS